VILRLWSQDGSLRIQRRLQLPDASAAAAAVSPAAAAAAAAFVQLAAACAAEPLSGGLTSACAAVLQAAVAQPSTARLARFYGVHALFAVLAVALGLAALLVPMALAWHYAERLEHSSLKALRPASIVATLATATLASKGLFGIIIILF
jgi:hypothetical protein